MSQKRTKDLADLLQAKVCVIPFVHCSARHVSLLGQCSPWRWESFEKIFPQARSRKDVEDNLASIAETLDAAPTYGAYQWPADLISAEHVLLAGSLDDGERVAKERLARLEMWSFCMRKGAEHSELKLQPAGWSKVARGYPLEIPIASFRADRFRLQMGGPACGPHEPYRVLNEFRPEGFIVEACATCLYFRFTGMTRDWSGGSSGYCTQISREATTKAMVSVRHSCPAYTFVTDEERRYPYIRHES